MIVRSSNNVTVISHATGGGKYIRKATLSLGAVSGFLSLNGWVLLLSHQPSTLVILVPFVEQEHILDELCTLFLHVHEPRLFGYTLGSMTLVV